MKKHKEIKQLLKKYLAKDISSNERNELFSRLHSIHDPEELDDIIKNHWKLNVNSENETDLSWVEILADHNNRIQREKNQNNRARVKMIWQWGIAASLLFLVGLVWWNWSVDSEYVTYKTGFGETKNILLDDGSSIVLNANSELNWKKNWLNDKNRYATLRGEAYFQISHRDIKTGFLTDATETEDRMPFRVKTPDVVIDVLGTTFNVSNWRGETMVFLEKGSVKLGLLDHMTSVKNNKRVINSYEKGMELTTRQSIVMEPGEIVKYSAESEKMLKSEEISPDIYTVWKDGTIVFEDKPLGDVFNKLEDIYGKKIETNDSVLLNKRVSMGIPYEDWNTVKILLEKSLDMEVLENGEHEINLRKRK